MNQKLVTVVVPIYNTEDNLVRCFDSILSQSYQNIELICIDDGSTDNSPEICDKYARKDTRVRVAHISNGGVSNARNTGLDMAQGEYIFFIDSDDWVEKTHIENLMPIEDENLVYGSRKFFVNGEFISERKVPDIVINSEQWIDDYSTFSGKGLSVFFINCCYDMKIIKEHNLRFNTKLQISEEGLFNLEYMKYCNKIRYSSEPTYCYEDGDDTSNSLSHRFHPMRMFADMNKCIKIEELTRKTEYYVRWQHWNGIIRHYQKWLTFNNGINRKESKQKLKECYKKQYFRESLHYIKKYGSLDEKVQAHFMFYGGEKLYKFSYNFLLLIRKIKNKIC